jgi:twitching motility protein PilU
LSVDFAANNADQALDRIINFFPEERHKQLFTDLSLNLQGIISQRLIPTVEGGRTAAIEILTSSPRMKDLIKAGKVTEIKEAMALSEAYGMQTFDLALLNLYKAGKITEEETLKNADSPNNLRLKLNSIKGVSLESTFEFEVEPVSVADEEETTQEQDFGQPFNAS